MKLSRRSAFLSIFALVILALAPVRVHAAAAPRVLALADLVANPTEVAISSKHLTLIHFETGDVSMVAVGEPAIVSVTVKGPDVLLKALTSSGSTNAFIWQANRYTQWTFTVRQNSKDPRVIIVRDSAANPRDESNSKNAERGEKEGKTATGPGAAAATSGRPAVGAVAASSVTTPAPAQQPSVASASQQSATAREKTTDICGATLTLDQFMKTLNAQQRELLGAFLAESTLARLQTLLSELSLQQRCSLLALLSGPASSRPPITGSPGSPGVAATTSAVGAQDPAQASGSTTENCSGSGPQEARSTAAAHANSLMPAGVLFSVTPQVVDGQLFLYYVLENHGEATLLTDILRLRILDRNGDRVAFRINRASQDGYVGRLEANSTEYGLIGVDAAEKVLVLEWKLVTLGSGAPQLLRMEVQVP